MKLLNQKEVLLYATYLGFGLTRKTAYEATINITRQQAVSNLLEGEKYHD